MSKGEAVEKTVQEEVPVDVATSNGDQAVAVAGNELADLFLESAGAGLNFGANDLTVPFYSVLQKGSPQVSRANAKYIKGAEVGMIMNTMTCELFSGEVGILFIPCGYQKSWVRWKPRDSGGGLVGHYRENDPAVANWPRNQRGQMEDKASGDIIVETAYHFGLRVPDEGEAFPEFGIVSMYSTGLKVSRNWNTIMRRVMKRAPNGQVYNPPSFSRMYRLTTIGQTKDNYDWFSFRVEAQGEVANLQLFKMALEFHKQIAAGNVRISAPPQEVAPDELDENGDRVPF